MGKLDDVGLLEAFVSSCGSSVALVSNVQRLVTVPPGTAWQLISVILSIWVLGALAVGAIDDIGSLGMDESGFELFDAVLMEIGKEWVLCIMLMLVQAFASAGFVWVVALTL